MRVQSITKTFALALFLGAVSMFAECAQADIIVAWTFENSGQTAVPNGGPDSGHVDPLIGNVSVGSSDGIYARGHHANTDPGFAVWQAATDNGPTPVPGDPFADLSWRSQFWSIGDYWELNFDPTGYTDLELTFDNRRGSFSGPSQFKLQTSTDGSIYTDLAGGNYSLTTSWANKGPFSLPDGTVNVRMVNLSNVTNVVGDNRLDNVVITGTTVIPEPSSVVLFGIAVVGLTGVAWQRKRQSRP